MQRIVPCLWFDDQADEAAVFYTSVFSGRILKTQKYAVATPSDKPVGSTMTVEFEVLNHRFLALNGGTFFTPNPSISFFVHRETKEEISALWEQLSDGGKILMPLGEYPFSRWYGWVQDKFGISWQLILPLVPEGEGNPRPTIVPSLLFVGDVYGKAEDAMKHYTSLFEDSQIGDVHRYGPGQEPNISEAVMYGDFQLYGQWFACMDSALEHNFSFSEGISLIVYCVDQTEIDYFYETLSVVPEAEMCGWIKDRYGISWQLTTAELDDILEDEKAMAAILAMKRININKLKQVKYQ